MQMAVSVKKDYLDPESLQCGQHDVKLLLSVTSDNIRSKCSVTAAVHVVLNVI